MRKNAIKFNGESAYISNSARSLYDLVKSQIELNREELTDLESAITDFWNGGNGNPPKKQKTATKGSSPKSERKNEVANVGGVTVNLGDISGFRSDTDSE